MLAIPFLSSKEENCGEIRCREALRAIDKKKLIKHHLASANQTVDIYYSGTDPFTPSPVFNTDSDDSDDCYAPGIDDTILPNIGDNDDDDEDEEEEEEEEVKEKEEEDDDDDDDEAEFEDEDVSDKKKRGTPAKGKFLLKKKLKATDSRMQTLGV